MKIGILGSGIVGTTLGTTLLNRGHEVMLGSRTGKSENSIAWKRTNVSGRTGDFSDAATFGDIAFNCTMGIASLDVFRKIGPQPLHNKILIDVANPLDFSNGMPPRLTLCNHTSLGEEIQILLPRTAVVKALNTIHYELMVNPAKFDNQQNELFICGDNLEAKQTVTHFLVHEFGWHREMLTDLGPIIHSRGTESLLLLIVSLAMKYGSFYQGIRTFHYPQSGVDADVAMDPLIKEDSHATHRSEMKSNSQAHHRSQQEISSQATHTSEMNSNSQADHRSQQEISAQPAHTSG
jgi:predicted dinucleotide-binding enzyme